jgi:predicted DNA-binding transcriptional regulator AlpA
MIGLQRDRLISGRELSDMLNISLCTLSKWRRFGSGPKFIRVNKKCVRYQIGDVLDWIEDGKRTCTRG